MKKIISIIGARPQFIKHAPMQLQLQKYFTAKTIHTGQHYDTNMSDIFFDELKIPQPDFLFDIGGSKPQGEQTAIMMTEIERVCVTEKPNAILVYGDTNSTLAGALVAAKMCLPLIHIEAGLRSFNRAMPEEVNRIIADEFSYLLFCPSDAAIVNLKKEGIAHERIFKCGDVMCDTIHLVRPKVKRLMDEPYFFATIHRPYNTDDLERLSDIIKLFNILPHKVVFAIHPRTVAKLKEYKLDTEAFANIIFIPPQGYVESISYQMYSECVITDSGGMQKEAYMLQKKCITIRSETEWLETLQSNWNMLIFENLDEICTAINVQPGYHTPDLYGNGNAAEEISYIINKYI